MRMPRNAHDWTASLLGDPVAGGAAPDDPPLAVVTTERPEGLGARLAVLLLPDRGHSAALPACQGEEVVEEGALQ